MIVLDIITILMCLASSIFCYWCMTGIKKSEQCFDQRYEWCKQTEQNCTEIYDTMMKHWQQDIDMRKNEFIGIIKSIEELNNKYYLLIQDYVNNKL